MSNWESIERYYRLHASIYDATRWSFLFGRAELLGRIAGCGSPSRILEVGCGTGNNLVKLRRLFPRAELAALDISADMLRQARKNLDAQGRHVKLLHRAYDQSLASGTFDLILFSYSLTMMNPDCMQAIDHARQDLAPTGRVAVVDFHDSALPWFQRWMGLNHVRMDGHLLPVLRARFRPLTLEVRRAYGGLWRYFLFIGEAL